MHKLQKIFCPIFIAGLLSACATGYQERNGTYVFLYWDEGGGQKESPIRTADANTFQVLNTFYAKDKNHAYFRGWKIQGADPRSFVALSDWYAKDTANVYYENRIIIGADPATFSLVGTWGRDKNDVYRGWDPISACDPSTFWPLDDNWERDSTCAYARGKRLENANPNAFVVINRWLGRDNNYVFNFLGEVIEGADVATFGPAKDICKYCMQDKNRCYNYEGKAINCRPAK